MKIVIAFDSFKGTISATKACQIVDNAIKKTNCNINTVQIPMADGGEGTAKVLLKANCGQWISKKVMGPLPQMQVDAGFAWFANKKHALIEMASASGLEHLSGHHLNPLKTTTFGTGELIKEAIEYGAQKIFLAVGGSATIDGGVGAAKALGWKFLDENNNEVELGGKSLDKIHKFVKPISFRFPSIEVLCDVDNPLCGQNGAARIFGPQKGANPQIVELLEIGMKNLAKVIKDKMGIELEDLKGAGAAGGLSAGAVAFMDAKLVSGIDTIIHELAIEKHLESADWVVTGEGCFDRQSLNGKVVSGILKIAKKTNTRVAVIAGNVLLSPAEYKKQGIELAIACKQDNMEFKYALENSEKLLYNCGQNYVKHIFFDI